LWSQPVAVALGHGGRVGALVGVAVVGVVVAGGAVVAVGVVLATVVVAVVPLVDGGGVETLGGDAGVVHPAIVKHATSTANAATRIGSEHARGGQDLVVRTHARARGCRWRDEMERKKGSAEALTAARP
jgi:hypothetical protein